MEQNPATQSTQSAAALNLEAVQAQIVELKQQLEAVSQRTAENKLSMIVFSGDLDKVLAAFIIATGAVAMGMEVVMFFTFWGTPVLRDKKSGGRQGHHGQDVRHHAAQGDRRGEALQDEHGRAWAPP